MRVALRWAAAFFNQLADAQQVRAISAGTSPGIRVHPELVTTMREVGLDLEDARPQRLTPELASSARHLITMGCGDECPFVPGAETDDWPIEDPKGKPVERVREIRDEPEIRPALLLSSCSPEVDVRTTRHPRTCRTFGPLRGRLRPADGCVDDVVVVDVG